MDDQRNWEVNMMCARLPNPEEPRWALIPENDKGFVVCVRLLISHGRELSENMLICLREIDARNTWRAKNHNANR